MSIHYKEFLQMYEYLYLNGKVAVTLAEAVSLWMRIKDHKRGETNV